MVCLSLRQQWLFEEMLDSGIGLGCNDDHWWSIGKVLKFWVKVKKTEDKERDFLKQGDSSSSGNGSRNTGHCGVDANL